MAWCYVPGTDCPSAQAAEALIWASCSPSPVITPARLSNGRNGLAPSSSPPSAQGISPQLQSGMICAVLMQGPSGVPLMPSLPDTPTSRSVPLANAVGPTIRWTGCSARSTAEVEPTGDLVADTSGAELEGQQRSERDAGGWQEPDGCPELPGGAGLHPPGPGAHAEWATVLSALPELAPALGFNDCLTWARCLAANPEGPGTAQAQSALRRMADGLAQPVTGSAPARQWSSPTGSSACVAHSRSCPWPRARGSGGRAKSWSAQRR